ncbi:hypothetical protein FACS1894172_15030 [Spirochaetia bacterium]|nr:hypothetical protein FACS1894172_15030 [Spirochaetia bacterium]
MAAGTKPSFSSVIAFICLGIYAVLIAFTGFKIVTAIQHNRRIARQEFGVVAGSISIAAGTNGFLTEDFQKIVQTAVNESSLLQGIIVSSEAGTCALERKEGLVLEWIEGNPRFVKRFGMGIFSDAISIEDHRNGAVSASYQYLDLGATATLLKWILAALVLTLGFAFTALVIPVIRGQKKPPLIEYKSPPEEDLKDPVLEVMLHSTELDPDSTLREHLEAELLRCARFDQDLVFIALEFKDQGERDSEVRQHLIDESIALPVMPDLVFETGKRGLSIILPGSDLEDGRTKVTDFQHLMLEKYETIFWEASDLCIGLSSRNRRSVDADRLISEARSALKRSINDPENSIIVFRSDPEKYKHFIDSKGKTGA